MRKRKLLAWILTVVMLFTVLGAFPMTVSAAGAEYADDATAAAAGYYFRTGAAGTATYYNSLVTACNEVEDGGTVYVVADYTLSAAAADVPCVIGSATKGDAISSPLWNTNKTITVDGGGHTATLSGNRPYNIANSDVTYKNWTVNSSTTMGQVRAGSSLTLDTDFVLNSTNNSWGAIAVYGTLTMKSNAKINATGTAVGNNSNATNSAIYLQKSVQTGDQSATSAPIVNINDTAAISSKLSAIDWGGVDGTTTTVNFNSANATVAGSFTDTTNNTYYFGGKTFANMTDDEKIAYKKILVSLNLVSASYINDTEAIADGQFFRIGAEGSGTYYSSLVTAANAVVADGTIELLADWTTNAMNTINPSTAKAFTLNGNGHTMTGTSAQYILDLYNCTMTINNLTFVDANDVNQMPFRIQPTASLIMKDCTYTVSNASWGGIGVMGSLTLDNTSVTTTAGSKDAGAIRLQNQNVGNTPTLILKNGASITGGGTYTGIYVVDAKAYAITVETPDVSISGVANISASVTVNLGVPTEENKAAWKSIYTLFGKEWPYDNVAKIGTTDYTSMSDAIAAVAEGGTITLTADLTSGIVANNGKSFTIDGDGHTVALSGSPALTVNAGTTLTVVNITLQSTTALNAVDLAGGALTLGNGAVVKSIYTNASGNSQGNGIRGTAAGSVLNVLDGATIQAGGGALVFDNQSATINISGGTITTDYYFMVFTGGGILDVTISGGTLTSTATAAQNAGAFRYYGGTHSLVITGGTINFANKTSMFGSASSLTAMKTPDWVRILGGTINKTTAGEEATLNVDSMKTAVAGLSLASGAAQLRIPVQASFGNSGIAFATTVDKATYDALVATYGAAAVKTGTLILPTANVPAELTYDNIVGLGTGKYLDVANSGFYNEDTAETDGNYLWYGSIVNLKAKNTNRDFSGVGYIGITTSVEAIGSATVAVCAPTATVANARTLATAAEEGNAAQNDLLNFFKTGEMPF